VNLEGLGRWLLLAGAGILIIGGLIWLLGRFFPELSRLPGTIRLQGSGFTCIIPLLASVVLSVLLTVLLNLLAKILK
jgi:hypothetical protein